MNRDELPYHRGLIDPGTIVYRPTHSQAREAFVTPHAWEIYAQRNLGGFVMFERDGEAYYAYDFDVYWFPDE